MAPITGEHTRLTILELQMKEVIGKVDKLTTSVEELKTIINSAKGVIGFLVTLAGVLTSVSTIMLAWWEFIWKPSGH